MRVRTGAAVLVMALLTLGTGWALAADSNAPLKIERAVYQDSQIPSQQALAIVDGQVVVHNETDQRVTGVDVALHIQDGNGEDLDVIRRHLGSLAPHQTRTMFWNWDNYSSFRIQPLAVVTCDGSTPHDRVRITLRATGPGLAPTTGGPLQTYEHIAPADSQNPDR